ncbi:Replication protein 15 [Burkholderia pseudomallei]|nr:Replication protein 15 [Burkholderia pseudomallei]CFK95657.1 Replication protein 15 [Burkholderia pseudomallei]CFT97652.1 Replication protein 15 [Burkholderia pseudomallei]CPG02261.1 Replication protein 15 [Burkholderia pseudomallei]CPG93094.1 Replication protein 15 [Burkholderia pseudomallei]
MGRIRTVKPELFTHEDLFEAEQETGLPLRVAFIGLFTCADREGRFKWRPRTLKLAVLPHDAVDFSRVLDALVTRGFLVRYASESGEEIGLIPTFTKHQVINNRETPSDLPAPPANLDLTGISTRAPTRDPRVDDASDTRAQGKGKEGKGKEGNEEANASVDSGAGAPPVDPTGDGRGEGDETGASGPAAADLLGDEVDDGGDSAGAVRLMCPVERIVAAYHHHMPDNPRVKVLNDKRKRAIAARWREASKLDCKPFGYSTVEAGLNAWRAFFTVCAQSEFLTGKARAQPGKPPFIADIDFLMSPEAFAKCLENKYHRDAA